MLARKTARLYLKNTMQRRKKIQVQERGCWFSMEFSRLKLESSYAMQIIISLFGQRYFAFMKKKKKFTCFNIPLRR